uniref:Protein phosphatase 1 regulatory subunit 26 n=1 Tax=Leptobrachium leishanense TaxID=445787 RepID=A0A8C5MM74_9ANUR
MAQDVSSSCTSCLEDSASFARMFLVNAPPLLAFKTTWAPFGQPATCKLPVSFSESEEDNSGTSITTQVQGIITNLQSDESSLDVTSDYEGIMQKNRKGEIRVDKGLTSSAAAFKAHSKESATIVVPTQFKDNKGESSGCGQLALESDSDDSVDRDIEEAIQEYLKKRGTTDPPSVPENAKSLATTEKESSLLVAVQKNAPPHTCPSSMEAKSDFFEGFRPHDRPRSASPQSVSSDDSFEQSINHEIEQFLQERKQQNIANETGKKDVQIAAAVRPKSKSGKAPDKPSSGKHGSRDPPGKPHAECISTQSKSIKTNSDGLKSTSNRKQPKANICRQSKSTKAPNKEAVKSSNELSDSSSDDGIEEAIQLYQLEKSRQECNLKIPVIVSPERVKAKPQTGLNSNPCSDKNLQERPDNRKRKLPAVKPAAPHDISHCQPVSGKRPYFVADNSSPKCETAARLATRCAETSAELMCAEAILDISKAILPSQAESTFTVLPANPPSHVEPDSDSTVDSDDSIEQEIRTFLARKAEAEGAVAAFPKQEPVLPDAKAEPDSQSTVSKNKLSLSQKRKTHENKPVQQGQATHTLQKVTSSNVNTQTELNKRLLPSETVENSCMRTGTYVVGRAKSQHPPAAGIAAGHHNMDVKNAESSTGVRRSPCKNNMEESENYSGDESSSLDSDEDLDTAIKDLLKSKKKCKKKARDTRSPCKKRVRFGESTCRVLEPYGTEQRNDHGTRAPPNKSCLVSSSQTTENSVRKTKSSLKVKDPDKVNNTNGEPKVSCASVKTEANVQPCALPQDQDSSSVDSDDSIEQEIRKFLAERARESAELSAAQQGSDFSPPVLEEGKSAQTVKQHHGVSCKADTPSRSSTTFTSITTPRHESAAAPKSLDSKQITSPVRQLHHYPVVAAAAGCSPVTRKESLSVKRECILAPSNVIKQGESPCRVVTKTETNGSQGKPDSAVSGNFVAGLKYISGGEKQLVLNVGPSRLTGDHASKQASCRPVAKKGPLLEKAKVVQTSVSSKTPLVRPRLYVLTTQVCKENSALCLPINVAPYETGLNLMSLQYCHGQVATRVLPVAGELRVQQPKGGDGRRLPATSAGGISPLIPKTPVRERRPSQGNEAGSGRDMEKGRCSQEKEQLSSLRAEEDTRGTFQPAPSEGKCLSIKASA